MRRDTDDAAEEARARGAVAREIVKAEKAVRGLRAFFGANAVLSAGVLGVFVLTLEAAGGGLRGTGLVFAVLLGLQTLVLAAGAFLLPRNPFPWAAGMAGMVTLGTLFRLLGGRIDVPLFLNAFWSVALWAAAFGASRLESLLLENPDSYAARRARGETAAAPEGEATARSRLREGRARRGALKGRAALLGIGAAVALVVGGSVTLLLRPPALEPALDRFQAAWDAGDAGTLGSLFRDPREGKRADGIRAFLDRRGWTPRPPAVTERRLDRRGERSAVVLFFLGEGRGNVETVWMLEGDRWVLAKLQPPP